MKKFLSRYSYDALTAGRNVGLDVIRSVAILLVLLAHLGIPEEYTAGVKIGGLGVEIFFVLSGFLIGQIVIRDFSKELSLSSIRNFWVRRWFRTIPLYYAVLLWRFVFIDHSLGPKILVYFLFLQNNFVGIDFFPVSWSLVIEEWFYLTLPILMLLYFRWKPLNGQSLLVFTMLFIVSVNLLRFGYVIYTNVPYEGVNGNFPFRLDSLMWGLLLACVKTNFQPIYRRFLNGYYFTVMLLLFVAFNVLVGSLNMKELTNQWIMPRTIWFTLNSALVACLFPFVETRVVLRSKLSVLLISCISIFSYSAYLLHTDLYRLFDFSQVLTKAWLVHSFSAIFVTFAVSGLVYGLFEKPMTELRNLFVRKRVVQA